MATSDQLRRNKNQHKAKNTESKESDKAIYQAMNNCLDYLKDKFSTDLKTYKLDFNKNISFNEMVENIKSKGGRKEFDNMFPERFIKPNGGVIWLKKHGEASKLVLVSEVKKQGTNDQRIEEGKPKQAQGNAIERLGKNLAGIRAMMNHEDITPFICFGWGCDFVENYDNTNFVMSKISMMNDFYELNKIYVKKRDGDSNRNKFSPVSMFFREKEWTAKEMEEKLIEIGETSMRYYFPQH